MKRQQPISGKDIITSEWTLFLDRDGVINRKIENGYVLTSDDFEFLPGALKALSVLGRIFRHIIIVTNQQGVGRGLLDEQVLDTIHNRMISEIEASGGRISGIYVATGLESAADPDRKPATGMAFKAFNDYPDIVASRSVMAGDSATDMLFGRAAGMTTVFIGNPAGINSTLIDYSFSSLLNFAESHLFSESD